MTLALLIIAGIIVGAIALFMLGIHWGFRAPRQVEQGTPQDLGFVIAPLNSVCQIACPILLVHGVDDQVVPLADAHAIVSHCPQAKLTLLEIPDAGHASVDKIEEHAPALLAFLREAGFRLS